MKLFSDYPLLERDGELEALGGALEAAGRGSGLCLVVEAPAGVGKTRLLEAVRTLAREQGVRTLAARAGEREREYTWGTLRSLFEPALLAADESELDSIWSGPAEICRPLLEAGSVPLEGTPDSSFAIFTGFHCAVRELSRAEPLLLAIDDLHWVDGPSLGFLEFLARRIEALPVAIVATLRPNEPGVDAALVSSLMAEPHGHCLRPQPLSRKGSEAALRSRLGEGLSDEVAAEAHRVTGGNPLLLSELGRTLEVEAGGQAAEIVPGTIGELGSRALARSVGVRLGRGGADGRRLAEAAAVLGEDALLGQAVELAQLEAESADRAALDLVRLEVLLPGSRVAFVHPVIRAAIYDALPAPERSRLHTRAIEILQAAGAPPERLASHILEVDPAGDPERVAILRTAATKAATGGDSRGATVLMRRALAEPPPAEQLTEVLSQLGAAELLVDGPSAVEHLRTALKRISEPAYMAAIAELLARALMFQERMGEAIEVCERAKKAIGEVGDARLERRIDAVLIETTMIEPEQVGPEYTERMGRLLEAAGAGAEDDYGSKALIGLSAIIGARDLSLTADEAARRSREAARGGTLIREGMSGIAQLAPSQALALSGRFEESIEQLEESMRWHERYGSVFGHLSNLVFLGRSRLFIGNLPEAVAQLEEALRLSRTYRVMPGVAWATALLAEAQLEIGDLDRAQAVIEDVIPARRPIPGGWHWINLCVSRARLWHATGDHEGALAEAERAGDLYAANGGVGTTWVSWRPPAIEAALALGMEPRAAELAEQEIGLARRWGAPREIGRALRLLGAVSDDRREPLLSEAVGVLEGSEARLELARALIELGAERRRSNRKADAREPLRRGMDLAHACGADALAERARSELRASGVRARRTALSGPESLTESERRVVELAAAGRSNKEIAGELFVTVKTVEVHLSNAYRKLGIKGRRELAAVLEPA